MANKDTDNKADLAKLRTKIDSIDASIQELISQRADVASKVAQSKQAAVTGGAFYRPEREAQVLRAVKARNNGPLKDETLIRLFREIMSACLAQQQPLKIAYLGPQGTFSEMATYQYFGHSICAMPVTSIDSIFAEVEAGIADFGMVPVENSTEGAVNNTLDMFLSSPLKICGELDLPINHNLISTAVSLHDIVTVFSHRQSLAQCRSWLKENLPHATNIAVSSNAEAAKRAQFTEHSAAIASESAATMYALNILHKEIEDQTDNSTRFLVIGKQILTASGKDKTSLLVAAKDQPGALFHILKPLSECGISMTRIESRPSKRGKWDYVFFIDVDGHKDDENLAKALRLLQRITTQLKVLGSYPQAIDS
ncbi:Chorismate mutase I / Prephenate dehydratase [hydrothermal vent metagenome]|uniref:Bifunctional chorismate mutase/prephenate dehydratase n=1 Tax=hydrothermal vent metagenome TaxID=652676 RepID=A0A3B0VKC3_9ZZZZ